MCIHIFLQLLPAALISRIISSCQAPIVLPTPQPFGSCGTYPLYEFGRGGTSHPLKLGSYFTFESSWNTFVSKTYSSAKAWCVTSRITSLYTEKNLMSLPSLFFFFSSALTFSWHFCVLRVKLDFFFCIHFKYFPKILEENAVIAFFLFLVQNLVLPWHLCLSTMVLCFC